MSGNLDSVLMNILGRFTAQAMANEIIGVQPMTGPAGQIFTLGERYYNGRGARRRRRVAAEIYRTFLRLHNRRRTQSDDDFAKAGYWSCKGQSLDQRDWCIGQFGEHGYWFNPITCTIWFATKEDHTQYLLAQG